jgi:uncharacterized membrane-anchored protein
MNDTPPSLVEIALRGALLVTAVALNVSQVSAYNYRHAFVTGALVSLMWWINAGKATSRKGMDAAFAYSFGAGWGTVAGMWLGKVIS